SKAQPESPVLDVRSESASCSARASIRLNASAARVRGPLQIQLRIIGSIENPFACLHLVHDGMLLDRGRMLSGSDVDWLFTGWRLQHGTRFYRDTFWRKP